ncbi:ShlB/FhaC/HecB family hemolysin secretion/activation protein [Sphingomonas sp. URHD0057]|uniref:ShlB/FhaC/HecB family hemolysin secretion/activation protein n=1 Tax=Sphingomonas sp. URHD0057 TaxID=1380389 RepID=UPI00056A7DB6|nr:ShlB/FhaC/HecB family hemolysin secretion/activation protein [Sphingomonas sp. URHD0057]
MIHGVVAAAAAAAMQPNPIANERIDQRPPATRLTPPPPRPRPTVAPSGAETVIKTIKFDGVEAPNVVAAAAAPFVGRPATHDTLIALAGALSDAYERSNVALYTVSIPDQDFADGVVVVDLAEGWVDSIAVKNANPKAFPLLTARASKLVGEKPLSRAHYERQSSLIQSIPGLKLDASFENPEGDDSVQLVLTPHQKRAEAAFGVNNRGPHLLGDLVMQGGLDFYRLLTDGDRLSFSGYGTFDLKHYRAADAAYAVPLGIDGMTLTATGGWLRTKARHIDIRGTAKFAGLTLTYPLLRRARQAADVSFAVDGVNSNNALFGNVFATERSRAARLAGSFVAASERHNFRASVALSRGLDIFNPNAGDTDGEVGFTKVNASAALETLLAARLLGRVQGVLQYSGDRLPAAELMSAGGADLGRAFDTGIVTGDKGIGGLVELAYQPVRAADFDKSEVYLFADAADVTVHRRLGFPRQSFSLASAGGGVRARYKDRMQLGVEGAAVLNRPYSAYTKNVRASVYYTVQF